MMFFMLRMLEHAFTALLEDLGSSEIKTMYMTIFLDKNGVIKVEFRHLKDQGFTDILEIPKFDDEII